MRQVEAFLQSALDIVKLVLLLERACWLVVDVDVRIVVVDHHDTPAAGQLLGVHVACVEVTGLLVVLYDWLHLGLSGHLVVQIMLVQRLLVHAYLV